jgi:hypothetical protein
MYKNPTFCPHSVVKCCTWIWEQTVVIYLYSINWLAFIKGRKWVYSVVRAASTKVGLTVFCRCVVPWIRRLVVRLLQRRPVIDSISAYVRVMVVKVAMGQISLRELWFPCQYHSTNASYSALSTCCAYQKEKRAKAGNLPERRSFGNRGALDMNKLNVVCFSIMQSMKVPVHKIHSCIMISVM